MQLAKKRLNICSSSMSKFFVVREIFKKDDLQQKII
jgi:hypothetical protein